MSALSTEIVTEWQRRAGEHSVGHFEQAGPYFIQTLDELASDEATWTITPHEGRSVVLLAGDTAFALLAFSGAPDGVTIKGALHPLDEGIIRVSFSDQLAAEEIDLDGSERVRPMVRRWAFDWHGRLQLPIEYWLARSWWAAAEPVVGPALRHHERDREVAHRLARGAGWPMPSESTPRTDG